MLKQSTLVLAVLLVLVLSVDGRFAVRANTTNTTNTTTKTNTTNTTTVVTVVAPSTYNKYCYACIFSNYTYCQGTSTCIAANLSCASSSAVYTNLTGCPTTAMCNYGVNGYGYIG